MSRVCRKNRSQHQVLQKRLRLLQEYIPSHYSAKFVNPCWYDSRKSPSRDNDEHMKMLWKKAEQKVTCDTPLSYNPSLEKLAIKLAKNSHVNEMYLHCLPSFFVSGFSKCASTTLHRMIIQHPQIAEPKCKENNFWQRFVNQQGTDLDKKMQILQYLNHFSSSISKIESDPQKIAFDASIGYLASGTDSDFCVLPNLLMRVLPRAKFIVIMRNPSRRVLSHYFYYLRKHFSSQKEYSKYISRKKALDTFHHQTSKVIMRFLSCTDSGHSALSCVKNKTIDDRNTEYYYVGLQTCMYYYHLLPWLSIWPRERFLFLRTEDLADDFSLTMSKVWHFLNLDDFSETKVVFEKLNGHPKLPAHTKELLDTFFQPHNELLANLLSDSRYLWKDI